MLKIPIEELTQQAKKILVKIKKNIIKYFNSFKDKENKDYFEFLNIVNILPDQEVKTIISVPDPKTNKFENIEINFNCPTKVEISFAGLIAKKVYVEVEFPSVLIGERFILPQVKISTQTYKPWFGNIGLVWEGLMGPKSKIGFHPFESKNNMISDLKKYYSEKIVDPLCDFINNYSQQSSSTIKKNTAKFMTGKTKIFWNYQSGYNKNLQNYLEVPITCEYQEESNSSFVNFRFFGVGDEWVPLARIVLDFLAPISECTSYFNEDGELLSEDEIQQLSIELESAKSVKAAEQKVADKKKESKEPWDPFKTEKAMKRDEFGFLMDKRYAEFGTKDVSSARQKVIESGQEHIRNIIDKEKNEEPPQAQDISRWASASAWFNEMQGKRFTVMGGTQNLSFKDKGDLNLLKSCNPPFMLRYARDQIRLNQGITGIEVQEIMFKFFHLGFLQFV